MWGAMFGKEHRGGTSFSITRLRLMLTSLWEHVWGGMFGKEHNGGTSFSLTRLQLMFTLLMQDSGAQYLGHTTSNGKILKNLILSDFSNVLLRSLMSLS